MANPYFQITKDRAGHPCISLPQIEELGERISALETKERVAFSQSLVMNERMKSLTEKIATFTHVLAWVGGSLAAGLLGTLGVNLAKLSHP